MKKTLLNLTFGIAALTFGFSSSAQTYTFTNCGATGRTGPTQGQVTTAYTSTTLAGSVTINTQGIQEWTVPATGTYSIQTLGAQGGTGTTNGGVPGGLGASIYGEYNLTAGTVLKIVVGQMGEGISYGTSNAGGGGGGGSFVAFSNNTPIQVAGGGGGTGANSGVVNVQTHGQATTVPGASSWTGSIATGGSGGFGGYDGAGGGGFYSDGQNSNTVGYGGQSFVNGAMGGSYAPSGPYPIGAHEGHGGFGCGGGVGHAGGGGGGYNGGNGTGQWGNGSWAGGGGSYNTGTNQTNLAATNAGMGQVVITLLCNPLNVTVTPSDSVCEGTPVTITGTSTGIGTVTWDNGITNGVAFPNPTAGVTTYTSSSTDPNDCVSQVTITVLAPSTGTDVQVACDSYTWPLNSTTYTSSTNTPTVTLTNAAGCDSVVTLNLTINNSTAGTDVQVACDSYTWPLNSTTYTSSTTTPTVTLTGANAAGCDSVVTLNLTINNSTAGTDVQVACDSYTWPLNSTTYTSSTTTPTVTLTGANAAGCDSVVTLNLTINSSTAGTDVITACDSITWIDGLTYTASNNTATFTLVGGNAEGCDSIVSLDLTINQSPFVLINPFNNDTICENDAPINLPAVTPTGGTYSGPGVVGAMFDPSIAGTGMHYVVYSVTDGNSCTSSDSSLIVVDACVGIDENNSALSGINVYPNPTYNVINVDLTGNDSVNFSLVTIDGRVIKQGQNITENILQIDLSAESKGIYFLRIDDNKSNKVFKVIKQ